MKDLVLALMAVGLTTTAALSAGSNSMAITLRKAVVSESKAGIEWEVVLSNSSPAAVRFSNFSLVSAVRAAQFKDMAGYSWRLVRPNAIIDPPSPAVDFRLRVAPRASVTLTLYTEGLEINSNDKLAVPSNKNPGHLDYVVNRDLEIIDDFSKRSSWWNCKGKGTVAIEWHAVE